MICSAPSGSISRPKKADRLRIMIGETYTNVIDGRRSAPEGASRLHHAVPFGEALPQAASSPRRMGGPDGEPRSFADGYMRLQDEAHVSSRSNLGRAL